MDKLVIENKVIAVIPARGGSKRIPHKNIVEFHGKPMIAWTIEAAQQASSVDIVFVDTDNEEIASISRQYGAIVPFLRDAYADDMTPVSQSTTHFIERLQAQHKQNANIVLQLMANCPLRTANDIDHMMDVFMTNKRLFQISCFKYGYMNPWWAYRLNDGKPTALFPEAGNKRSQDLEDLFCPTGAIWIAKVAALLKAKTFYGKDFALCPMSWIAAMDIDDNDDLLFAKTLKTHIKS